MALFADDLDVGRDAADEAYAAWERVETMNSPKGWVYRVALNLVRRRARRLAVEHRYLARHRTPAPSVPAPANSWRSFDRWPLPTRQRQAVALRYVAHLEERDIATAMGISRGAVAATLSAARKNLAHLLSENEASEEIPDG